MGATKLQLRVINVEIQMVTNHQLHSYQPLETNEQRDIYINIPIAVVWGKHGLPTGKSSML